MNDEAMQQLKDYLDKRFDAIDRKFEAVDARLGVIDRKVDAVEGRLDNMQTETERRFTHLTKSLERLAADGAKLQGTVQAREKKLGDLLAALDGYVLRAEHTADVLAAVKNQTDRHEKWLFALGAATGVTLDRVTP